MESGIKPRKLVFQISLTYALYMLLITYIQYFLGVDAQNPDTSAGVKILLYVLTYGGLVAGIFYAQKNYRAELGGTITFMSAFSIGFKIASLSGLLLGIFLILYFKILNPDAFVAAMETIESALDNNPKMDDAQKEMALSITRNWFSVITFGGTVFGMIMIGCIISLIGAAIFKKDPPVFTLPE